MEDGQKWCNATLKVIEQGLARVRVGGGPRAGARAWLGGGGGGLVCTFFTFIFAPLCCMALTMLLVTCGVSFTGFGGAAQMGMMALGGG